MRIGDVVFKESTLVLLDEFKAEVGQDHQGGIRIVGALKKSFIFFNKLGEAEEKHWAYHFKGFLVDLVNELPSKAPFKDFKHCPDNHLIRVRISLKFFFPSFLEERN